MATKNKRTLLERYGIPLNHLDFEYVKTCTNANEMEKIVQILRSGEEGYYPDLTKSAEEKLRELQPNSKLFNYEEQLRERSALPLDEWKRIYNWNQDIKSTDQMLNELSISDKEEKKFELSFAPIRKGGKIFDKQEKNDNVETNLKYINNSKRIKSTDYAQWDKFDAEEEILRMDLDEERNLEEIERKNRYNQSTYGDHETKFSTIKDVEHKRKQLIESLTELEQQNVAEEIRLRGNECFRVKDYDSAIVEYTRSLEIYKKNPAAFNNRAISYIMSKKYLPAIEDCKSCLALEPNNLKARLRLAQAMFDYGKKRESYDYFQKVLEVDPKEKTALKFINELRLQLPDIPPPPDTTRIKIQDCQVTKNITQPTTNNVKQNHPTITIKSTTELKKDIRSDVDKTSGKTKSKCKDYDLVELIKPNKIVPNKYLKAAESLEKIAKPLCAAKDESPVPQPIEPSERKLIFPTNINKSPQSKKKLIEEI
ncbi:sperm-associated antigen 1-like [Teleopsis dalmanni]|uniref:sperm-associated antigen 1-like n=1 Tax=Teleopsis dalmanni TaxID=139649 RepID=UPI0018CF6906|nr:sperm-associated antigen 1-like [Teleopsis dalmanni]